MTAIIFILVWILALVLGSFFTYFSRVEERRWTAMSSLVVSFVGAIGLGVVSRGGADALTIGLFQLDAIPTTVAPAMLIGAMCLVLLSGREDAAGSESSWLLAMLAVESMAVMSGSLQILLVAETVASFLLAVHAKRRGHKAHFVYLAGAGLALLIAAVLVVALPGEIVALPAVILIVVGALLRLGIFPFSTGVLASLQHGTSTATLMASLPFGGVLLFIRISPSLSHYGWLGVFLMNGLLISAPLAASLAISQRRMGRSLGYMLVSICSMIVLGAISPSAGGQLGGELLWAGGLLTATGYGAVTHLVGLRVGDPDLSRYHGLHNSAPVLSLAFLLLGVSLAGAPGSIEFVAEDILLNTVTLEGTLGMEMVVVTIALLGFNVLRMHFRLFFGAAPNDRSYLRAKPREILGLSLVGGIVLLGGVAPSVMPLLSAAAAVAGH